MNDQQKSDLRQHFRYLAGMVEVAEYSLGIEDWEGTAENLEEAHGYMRDCRRILREAEHG